MNPQIQNLTKDTHTHVTHAMEAFFEAQIAIQKRAIEATRAAFDAGFALQRRGVETATGLTTSFEVKGVNEETVKANVERLVAATPGLSTEAAERIVRDTAAALAQVNVATREAARVLRDATTGSAESYARLLTDVEGRSKAALDSVDTNAEHVARTANRVGTEWREAFFGAVEAALATNVAAESTESVTGDENKA